MNNYQYMIAINMIEFAERLKMLRTSRNITQARLAELIDVDPRVYNRWERGTATPQFETIMKIADILKISMDEIAGRTKSITQPKINNPELRMLYPQVDDLPDTDQQALVLVIDSFVRKANVQKAMKSAVG